MPNPAARVSQELAGAAKSLDQYLRRQETLRNEGRLTLRDLNMAYGMAFLSFHTRLEASIEDLFLGIVMGRLIHSDPQVRPLVQVKSEVVARKVVFGTRSYADWLPYDRWTIARAKTFLSSGAPFNTIPKADQAHLDSMALIRNAIAHASPHADRQFRKKFVEGHALPPGQRTPLGYLAGQHALGQTRINYLFSRTLQVMTTLV